MARGRTARGGNRLSAGFAVPGFPGAARDPAGASSYRGGEKAAYRVKLSRSARPGAAPARFATGHRRRKRSPPWPRRGGGGGGGGSCFWFVFTRGFSLLRSAAAVNIKIRGAYLSAPP